MHKVWLFLSISGKFSSEKLSDWAVVKEEEAFEMENGKKGVHDPTIIQVGEKYYLFSTDTTQPATSGVPIRQSDNLLDWEFVASALPNVPVEAQKWTNAKGLWAPEIIQVNDTYRMYYSASTFGSTTSMIGLATAENILGPWEDAGEVVKTNSELANHNAIDANVCYDRQGNPWMAYGSFFGGIYLTRLNQRTGKCLFKGDYGKQLAIRSQAVEGAIEGPFIYYHPETDYFYLFLSFDSLNDTYNIRVARSKEIDGPYLDMNGQSLTDLTLAPDTVGTKLVGSYQWENEEPVYGPGHNSIFFDQKTKQLFVVHHKRRKPFTDEFSLQIRPLLWAEDGWPVVGVEEYDGEITILALCDELLGDWEWLVFQDHSDLIVSEKKNLKEQVAFEAGIFYQNKQKQIFFTGRTPSNHPVFGRKKVN